MGFEVWARWLGLSLCVVSAACGGEATKPRIPAPPSAGASSHGGSGGGGEQTTLGGDNSGGTGRPNPTVAGFAGGTWEGAGGAGAVYCRAYASCSLANAACATGTSCYGIPGCSTPICIDPAAVCKAWCVGECQFLLSLPGQLACQSGQITGIEGGTGEGGAEP